MTQPAIEDAMDVSLSTVNPAHTAYDPGGLEALRPKPCGGRKRENITIAQEKAFPSTPPPLATPILRPFVELGNDAAPSCLS